LIESSTDPYPDGCLPIFGVTVSTSNDVREPRLAKPSFFNGQWSEEQMHPQPLKIDPIPISVIIVCRPMMLSEFARIFVDHVDINVVLTCGSGKVGAAAIHQFVPDVALLDTEIFDLNVLDILSSIAADGLKTKVVCLSASSSHYDTIGVVAMGAKGIFLKDAAPNNIVDCVRDVFHGKNWLPAPFIDALPEHEVRHRRQVRRSIGALTAREHQVALLVCDGLTNKQLGQQLDLTEGTVKVHLHKIYRKLGVRNRAALSALAMASRAPVKSRRGRRPEGVGQMT
jgi:DNA-binding NarL/FixJ family response regulator